MITFSLLYLPAQKIVNILKPFIYKLLSRFFIKTEKIFITW